jgi:hypothetical protein
VENIKTDLGKIGWCGLDSIDVAQDRDKWRALVNAVIDLRVPKNAGKLSSGCVTGGLPISFQLHVCS